MRLQAALTWGRLLCVLVILLASVQVYHMFLLNRLEAQNQEMQRAESLNSLEHRVRVEYPILRHSIQKSPVIDTSGQYRIVYDLFQSKIEEPTKQYSGDVTLVTHCSVNHAYHLKNLTQSWQGPISVAIFVPNLHETVLKSLIFLHHCLADAATNHSVSIHLVFPMVPLLLDPLSSSTTVIPSQNLKCSEMKALLNSGFFTLGNKNYALGGDLKYPNNLLRNVARRGASLVADAYIMNVDIDLLPSENLHRDFAEFFRRLSFTSDSTSVELQKTAYVVPAFEIFNNVPVPKDKKTLVELWEQGFVRQFYLEPCAKCQGVTNYTAWKHLTTSEGLSVSYTTTWVYPWEPFYIGPASSLPFYDERFKQYGLNRVSQICEMYVAGFQFAILNNAFLVHLGLKSSKDFHPGKEEDHQKNKALYHRFKEELNVKYPDSQLRC